VVSSDACRAIVADDEAAMDANDDAFELVHTVVAMRLRRRLMTVVDATNLQGDWRRPLLDIAGAYACPAVAIVFDVDEPTLLERNRARADHSLPPSVVHSHVSRMHRSLNTIGGEGFEQVVVLRSAGEVDAATVERSA
jgi:predicted kinase